jgi:hypothetical protein
MRDAARESVEGDRRLRRLDTRHRRGEPVPAPNPVFDVRFAALLRSERFTKCFDGLDDAVVGDGEAGPRSFDESLSFETSSPALATSTDSTSSARMDTETGSRPRSSIRREESSSNGPKR